MSPRLCAVLLASMAASAGCSSGSSDLVEPPPADQYTVSYRNQVRLPPEGTVLAADSFAAQLRTRDPIAPIRCLAEESPAFKDVTTFLGGIAWSHPMAIVKDSSFPPLFDARISQGNDRNAEASPSAGASDSSAAPAISRPDLVGVSNGIAIFLSKQHGLLAVDARGPDPTVSCSMKLPGEPKNFLFKDNELVIVVNARSGSNRSALLRYSFDGAKFHFVDSVRLENQTIQDARLFDSTIVAYTSWTKAKPAPEIPPPPVTTGTGIGAGTGGGYGGPSRGEGASMGAPASQPYRNDERLGTKLIVVKWDGALAIDWEDSLLDDPAKQDPMEGVAPGTKYTTGDLVSERKTYKDFVTASDRYIVVPRDVQQTRFTHYETYNYQVCTSYNPKFEEVTVCSVNYERRANPDYQPPSPTTGDYSCNGKKLADCIQAAAPTVSQYVHVPVGQSCQQVWNGRCEKYENRSETYPRFTTEKATELSIYRFENGGFSKFDSSLAKMVEKDGAIAFEKTPLSVKGSIANKNQVQFQNGHLYVFSDQALQTMAIAGNSISYLNRLDIAANTESNPAIVFSGDRAMISAYQYYSGTPQSQVTMLDLTTPSLPKQLNAFDMPGTSSQLILANGGILGPGQVSFTNQQVHRSLQKLTLFSKDGGQELDNLLLGTEYDAFDSSYFDSSDDQRIRLSKNGARMFLPYSGRHHADSYEPTAHRLNITRIDNARLVSERSFSVSDDVIRTAALDDERSLAFANSAAYLVDHRSGDWVLSTIRELFVPFATYRMSDVDLHARISRVGSKCRITTHAGPATVFGEAKLAQADIACPEYGSPTGYGSSLFFAQTRTGVRIGKDGLTVEPLSAAEVEALTKLTPKSYCWIVGGDPKKDGYGSPIEYLDAVPAKILCERLETSGGGEESLPGR